MEDIISTAFRNDAFVFWMAITLIVVAPSVSWMVADVWRKNRQAEIDAALKHRMLGMNMTAEEIERVIAAQHRSDEAAVNQNIGQQYWS